jgi:O-antigen/teichoic acid export membrane protein
MLKKPILNTIFQVVGKAVTVLISLVTTGILTRKLGPGIYGSYTLVTSVFLLLDSAADFGTKIIGVRESADKKDRERNKTFAQITILRLIISSIAFLLGLVLIFTYESFRSIRLEAFVSLCMIWFTSLAGSLEMIFQTRMRMDLKVIGDILFPGLFLITLLFWNRPITLLWVFGVYLIARIFSLFVGFGCAWEVLKNIFSFKIDWSFAKNFLKESWPMGIYLIVFTGYDRAVDSIMIERFIGTRDVAFYGLAYKIYTNLIQPAYFFVNSIFPLMSSKMTERRKLFKWSSLLMVLGILILIPTIYVLAPWIIQILAGNGYEASVTVLRILLIALFFSYVGHLVGFTLIAKGGQKEILVYGSTSLVFNILANLYAVPRYGIIGAALVTGMTEALTSSLMVLRLWRSSR